ncbi:MAG: hypothetical protein AB7G40_17775 [Hyphomonadaceae bacterium]
MGEIAVAAHVAAGVLEIAVTAIRFDNSKPVHAALDDAKLLADFAADHTRPGVALRIKREAGAVEFVATIQCSGSDRCG